MSSFAHAQQVSVDIDAGVILMNAIVIPVKMAEHVMITSTGLLVAALRDSVELPVRQTLMNVRVALVKMVEHVFTLSMDTTAAVTKD